MIANQRHLRFLPREAHDCATMIKSATMTFAASKRAIWLVLASPMAF
jgi:hypothetical protein